MKRLVPTITAVLASAFLLAGCSTAPTSTEGTATAQEDSTSPAPVSVAAAPEESVDPLTCYLAGEQGQLSPKRVTVTCGGGVSTGLKLDSEGLDQEAPVSLGDFDVDSASVGTSVNGTPIIRVHVSRGDEKCTYHRDMADAAEASETKCS